MLRNTIRTKFERQDKNILLTVSHILDKVDQIIWEHGGSVSRLISGDGFLVCFPSGTQVVDCSVDVEQDYECPKWIYTMKSADKLIWISATLNGAEFPVLQREKAPWN